MISEVSFVFLRLCISTISRLSVSWAFSVAWFLPPDLFDDDSIIMTYDSDECLRMREAIHIWKFSICPFHPFRVAAVAIGPLISTKDSLQLTCLIEHGSDVSQD
jgi:hypothetical protein